MHYAFCIVHFFRKPRAFLGRIGTGLPLRTPLCKGVAGCRTPEHGMAEEVLTHQVKRKTMLFKDSESILF